MSLVTYLFAFEGVNSFFAFTICFSTIHPVITLLLLIQNRPAKIDTIGKKFMHFIAKSFIQQNHDLYDYHSLKSILILLLYCNNAKQRSRVVKFIFFRIQPPAYRRIGRTGACPQFLQ